MTLNQLYYIVAVDNFRHFNTAANHCFVTQPTLSMQIQKLEEEFGLLIFDRSKHPVVPTEMGARIIKQARIILRESERLQSLIDSEKGTFSGTLKIGIIPTVAPYLIPLFIQPFVDKYPEVELVIDEIATKEITTGIYKDLIDVGIVALPINSPDLVEESLYFEPFIGYVSCKHKLSKKEKLSLDDLSGDDLLLLKEGHCLREQTLKLCGSRERVYNEHSKRILFESGTIDTLKKLVEQNFGFTLLPYLAIAEMKKEKDLSMVKEFASPVPRREIGAIYSKAQLKKHLVTALADEIRKSVPEILLNKEDSFIVPYNE